MANASGDKEEVKEEASAKMLSLENQSSVVRSAYYRLLDEESAAEALGIRGSWPDMLWVYEDMVIVCINNQLFESSYTIDGTDVEIDPLDEWVEVEMEFVTKSVGRLITKAEAISQEEFKSQQKEETPEEETTLPTKSAKKAAVPAVLWAEHPLRTSAPIATIGELKTWRDDVFSMKSAKPNGMHVTIAETPIKAMGNGVIGGYLVTFTEADSPDLDQDFFDAKTDYGQHLKSAVYYDHGLDELLELKNIGGRKGSSLADMKVDNVGVWIQQQLDMSDEYEEGLYRLSQMKKCYWSSGTASHLVRRTAVKNASGSLVNHVDVWPLGLDASITVRPASGKTTAVVTLKAYKESRKSIDLKAILEEVKATSTDDATDDASGSETEGKDNGSEQFEEIDMDIKDLTAAIGTAVTDAIKPVSDRVEEVAGGLDELKAKLAGEPATNDPGFDTGSGGDESEKEKADAASKKSKNFDALYNARFGDKTANQINEHVMNELAGGNYKQFIWQQNGAFNKYLRQGTEDMGRDERKVLRTQVFAPTHVNMLLEGDSVDQIKTTMIEAQGSLGGYAVPANFQEEIIKRLPGMTVVRGNGATVITLTRGNSVDAPLYTGGDDRYVGNLRGQWGTEVQVPGEQNATLGEISVPANIYTYKIPMSQSLVEDASNLVSLIQRDILDTLAMDEDETFLIGDGVGKPLGILPGSANFFSFNEVVSGSAAAYTTTGIKKLKRGLAAQYRRDGVFVGNSDTYGDIELLTVSGTGSDFAFPSLSENDTLLRRPATESEAMPDIAANSYSLLFAQMMGYWIVERAGLTIQRFQDSNTGINKVEFHVRKRVGGRPVEPWRFAVQKTSV